MMASTPDGSPVPVQQAHTLPPPEAPQAQQLQLMQQMQQMQQVSAMQMQMAMAAASAGDLSGLCGAMGPPAAAPMAPPAAAPAYNPFELDPASYAAAAMFAQMLQAQGGACGGCDPGALSMASMPVQPPALALFPSLPSFAAAPAPPPMSTVLVSVEGMMHQYQLTDDDLQKVFSRYGSVTRIAVDEAGTSAQITFQEFHNAQSAMADLNGKVLNGLEGTLRLEWACGGAATPAALPPMGMPGVPPMPGWCLPGSPPPPPAGMAPAPGDTAPLADLTNTFFAGAMGISPPPHCNAFSVLDAATPIRGADLSANFSLVASDSVITPQKGRQEAAAGPGHVKGVRKYTCRFLIGIENDKDFQVVRRIIGAKGANMKRVVKQTEAKLRLRGVGSGYFEGAGQRESSEPLQLCVSCTSLEGYQLAVRLVEELMEGVFEDYRQFCRESGRPEPHLLAAPHPVSAGGRGGGGRGLDDTIDDSDCDGESPAGKKEGRRRGRRSRARKGAEGARGGAGPAERGDPPPKAPALDEIERAIDSRNEARRQCNFAEADRLRQSLHEKGVALMDEPGARGKGTEVTTWRYWRD